MTENKNAWLKYENKDDVLTFAQEYRQFLSKCKTERECVSEGVKIAEAHGFKNVEEYIAAGKKLMPGDKVYHNHKGKDLTLYVIGSDPIENGLTMLGAHIDSPRLDLKQHPIYEDHEIALADTHYYGGIKTYQWVAMPLALHGVVVKKDGTVVNVVIGEDEDGICVGISDLLIHLAHRQMEKPASNIIEGEDLNVTIGSLPLEGEEKEAVKANVLKLLKEQYDIEEDDFVSAEIEVVPAGKVRNYGLDNSMLMGYGHDDRVCAYTSLRALLEIENPKKTCACLLVDKEEIGSVGATGMHSHFFENTLAEIITLKEDYSELKLRRALANTSMLSNDVGVAYDPNYPGVYEMKNTAFFGHGVAVMKYTGSRGKSGANDANAEYMAKVRAAFDKHDVSWQTAEIGRVNEGGGGTISYIMANYGMNIIDTGVPVQNMHAPWEVVSKADVFEAKQAYVAFLKEM